MVLVHSPLRVIMLLSLISYILVASASRSLIDLSNSSFILFILSFMILGFSIWGHVAIFYWWAMCIVYSSSWGVSSALISPSGVVNWTFPRKVGVSSLYFSWVALFDKPTLDIRFVLCCTAHMGVTFTLLSLIIVLQASLTLAFSFTWWCLRMLKLPIFLNTLQDLSAPFEAPALLTGRIPTNTTFVVSNSKSWEILVISSEEVLVAVLTLLIDS